MDKNTITLSGNGVILTLEEIKKTALEIKNNTSYKHSEALGLISKHLGCNNYNTLKSITDKNKKSIFINENIIDAMMDKIIEVESEEGSDLEDLLNKLYFLILKAQGITPTRNAIQECIARGISGAICSGKIDIESLLKSHKKATYKDVAKELHRVIQTVSFSYKLNEDERKFLASIEKELKRPHGENLEKKLIEFVAIYKKKFEENFKSGEYRKISLDELQKNKTLTVKT